MNNKELLETTGGNSLLTNSAFVNAMVRGFNLVFDLGRTIGTIINMAFNNKKCS